MTGISLIVTFVVLFGNYSVFGQRQVTGKVVDAESKEPIKEARVSIKDSTVSTTTNTLGFFQLTVANEDNLIIEAEGYEKSQIEVPALNTFQIGIKKFKDVDTTSVNEEMAAPYGGVSAFYSYISNNLKIPMDARNIKGKVFVEFIIDSTGQILPEDVKVVRGLSPSCDAEAIRVIRKSPPWVPGRQGNKRVRQRMVIPISFNSHR